jgi:hypothetical protein
VEAAQVLVRRWKYACPPRYLFDAVEHNWQAWLGQREDELRPSVVEARTPERILFRPWLDPAIFDLEVLFAAAGAGSQLTVVASVMSDTIEDGDRRRVRHRLGVAFGASLRGHVDGW